MRAGEVTVAQPGTRVVDSVPDVTASTPPLWSPAGRTSAAVPPEQLYTEGPLAHEFPRTVSRLNEMQSKEFLALERRVVDTSLT